jgi:mannosyl-3-phosphoglycerate phosphatase family protein
MKKIVIFTDLDGTLLDAESYSFDAASPALALIDSLNIPLVCASSKTRAEIEALRRQLGNHHPFISENGGGVFIPPGYFSGATDETNARTATIGGYEALLLGLPYAEIRARFSELRSSEHAAVRGFGDMSAAEVSALTGLEEAEAALAQERDFEEPFVFDGAPDEHFLRAIEASNLNWTQGRIFHILGDHDKGRAVRLLLDRYRAAYGAVSSIGLGDAYNDLPLLAAVNHAVLVRHPDGGYAPRIDLPGLIKTELPGPAGWNSAVLELLTRETTP